MGIDIKEKINEIVDKVKNDPKFMEQFQKEPVKAVESVVGVDLPDDVVEKVVEGVKGKVTLDKAGDLFGKIKGMF